MNDIPLAPYPLLVPLFENFPAQLVNVDQWVVWKGEWLPEKGKYNKIPFDAKTGKKASSTDRATWATFEQAKRCYQRGRGNFAGVGFVLSAEDAFAGVDLDSDCPQEKSDAWVALLDSYTEVSPSGKGLRVFVLAKLPAGDRKRGPVECYQEGRFLTVTGHVVEGTPITIEERQLQVECFHLEAFPVKDKPKPHTERNRPYSGSVGEGIPGDDTELLSRAFESKNGAEIAALYSGDTSAYGGDHSAAELGLCNRLIFWTGPDPVRLDRLFRASGLMREKWDERHYSNGETYGEHTVAKAIAGCSTFYSPMVGPSRNGHEPKTRKTKASIECEPETIPTGNEKPFLPEIIISGRNDSDIAADCWKEVHGANTPPKMFARGLSLARVCRNSDTGRITIEVVDEQRMLYRLRRTALFVSLKPKKESEETTWIRTITTPPPRIAKDMLVDDGQKEKLPPIRSIMYAPVVNAKGRIIHTPGYHPGDKIYLDTTGLPAPPKTATKEDALAAYGRLFTSGIGIFGEFPYASQSDRANAIVLLLTPFLRPYVWGNAPLALVESAEQGSGKTLLAKNMLRVFDPYPTEPSAPTSRDAKDAESEWTKVLATAVKGGPSVLYFDNIRGTLASQGLESLLTTEVWTTRLLGTNDDVTAWPFLITLVASSNNTEANRDMARRCYIIRLDPNMERPESRTGFHIPDLDNYVKENRGEILTDVLTILTAWIQSGRPEGGMVKGSFQRWASVMSGILDFLGVPGFMKEQEERETLLDPEKARWTRFVAEWFKKCDSNELSAKDLVEIASEEDIVDKLSKGASRSLGKMLSKNRERVFGGLRIASRTAAGGICLFCIKKVG